MKAVHGHGGHGRSVADAMGDEPFLWTDDAEGTEPPWGSEFICAIGDNATRKRIGGGLTVIHPAAVVSDTATIGRGVFIGALAVIGPCATVCDRAIINTGAIVEHDCRVGPCAHIASGAVLSGNVRVGEGAMVGAGSVVKQGLSIGDWSTVGCGAAVVCDVPSRQTWVGVPARPLTK